MIDHQSQMSFATKSIDAIMLHNNAARIFGVATILTTVAEKSFPARSMTRSSANFPASLSSTARR